MFNYVPSGKIQLWWDSKLAAFGFDGIQVSVPKSNHIYIKETPKILSYIALWSNLPFDVI